MGNVTYLNTVALTGTYDSGGVTVDTVYGGVYNADGTGPISPPGVLQDYPVTNLGNSVYGWDLDFTGITIGNWVYSVQLQAYNSVTGVRSDVTTKVFVYDTVPPTLPSNYLVCTPSVVVKGITPGTILLAVYAVDSLSPVLNTGFYLTSYPAGATVTDGPSGGDAATPPGSWKAWTIDTTNVAPGTYTVTARVYDAAGNYAETSCVISVLKFEIGDTDADHVYYYRSTTPDTISFTVYGLPTPANYDLAFGRIVPGSGFTVTDVIYGCVTNGWRLAGTYNTVSGGHDFTTSLLTDDDNGAWPVAVQIYKDGSPFGPPFVLKYGSQPSDLVFANLLPYPPADLIPAGWAYTKSQPPFKARPALETPGLNLRQVNANSSIAFVVYQPPTAPGGYQAIGEIEFAQADPTNPATVIDLLYGATPETRPQFATIFKALRIALPPAGSQTTWVSVYTDRTALPEAQAYLSDKPGTLRLFNVNALYPNWVADFSVAQLAYPIPLSEALLDVAAFADSGVSTASAVYWPTAAFVYGEAGGTISLPVTHFSSYAISPDVGLSGLSASAGSFTPAFDPDVTAYALTVANSVYTTTVTPTVAAKNLTITVNGQPVADGTASQPIDLDAGPNTITIRVSGKGGAETYTLTITRKGVVVSPKTVAVSEGGPGATYTLKLATQPTATVTVNVYGDSQVSVTPTSLTFDGTNYNLPQTVTVTAVDDRVIEGSHTGTVTHSATSVDPDYNNILIAPVTVNIADNDVPGGAPPPAVTLTPGTTGILYPNNLLLTAVGGVTDVTVPEAAVQALLGAGKSAIVLDLTSIGTPLNVILSPEVTGAVTAKRATLTIWTKWAELTLPPGALPSGHQVTVKIGPADLPARLPAGAKAVGQPASLEIATPEGPAKLNKRVTLALPYEAAKVSDTAGLFAYRINEDGSLTCLGGTVAAGKVAVELSRLSKYGLFEYRAGFTDITGHWAKRDILFGAARGITKGVSATSFAPERAVTRAEFAALMLNALGISPTKPVEPTFRDVAPDKWYFSVVETAYQQGLVSGVGAGRFDPERRITREEMAALLLRALKKAGVDVALTTSETAQLLGRFTDRGQIAPWAENSVAAAVKAGLLSGNPDGSFAPRAATTRAMAIVVAKRVLEAVSHLD
ncbi:S-layer family protein [Thermodesulfitimonas autotrophica]|uniref:S-layer family protein n=1 Tax=Thermodesulfitimonas autotrophica TaxID=1894989 RepID=A0A3N5AE36_9THEO|nr:S-layer homology domain-containing protein [Thermodesulfitimonas autotrophica]RPF42904.1 S-layer family protein [Thermodesulfitimonas autotrophica]